MRAGNKLWPSVAVERRNKEEPAGGTARSSTRDYRSVDTTCVSPPPAASQLPRSARDDRFLAPPRITGIQGLAAFTSDVGSYTGRLRARLPARLCRATNHPFTSSGSRHEDPTQGVGPSRPRRIGRGRCRYAFRRARPTCSGCRSGPARAAQTNRHARSLTVGRTPCPAGREGRARSGARRYGTRFRRPR